MSIAVYRCIAVVIAVVAVAWSTAPAEAAYRRHHRHHHRHHREYHRSLGSAEYGRSYAGAPGLHHHRVAFGRGRVEPMG